ncbi:thrombospondin [Actinoplanes sp. RD1]|uniref:thrombospondin n=1 Tax=Actinoplanes sp. RD1 TaxID=3064538 RepID=UPI00274084C2|nr:thrombospondin [Actinoplanes sp. RD1]
MRIPTFSRQTGTTTETDDRAPVGARSDAPAATSADHAAASRDLSRPSHSHSPAHAADRRDDDPTTVRMDPVRERDTLTDVRTNSRPGTAPDARTDSRPGVRPDERPAPAPVAAGPKPRASLLATLGLITGVAGALLVLSGPLLGYGIGVAGLALVLSVAGIRATRKRHIAGKTDALIGMVLALGAIVVGVLALTGSLSWLGTDLQPVTSLREWLDTQFVNRF